jgi:hypothetical protein
MKEPARREIVCAVILDTEGKFLLQQRDDVPGILHPGKGSHICRPRVLDQRKPSNSTKEPLLPLGMNI